MHHQNYQYAKNAVFVAKTGNLSAAGGNFPELDYDNIYVVAIAATNATSLFDWIVEDGKVNQVIEWSKFDPKGFTPDDATSDPVTPGEQYISAGTAIGVSELVQNLTSPHQVENGAGTKLLDFLDEIDGTSSAVIFAGHSLAGALSPTLAKYFSETINSEKPSKRFAAVHAYPTAGATPGNAEFSKSFSEVCKPLPAKFVSPDKRPPHQYLNVRLWNHYDVVPHAWAQPATIDFDGNETPKIGSIPSLYGNNSHTEGPQKETFETIDKLVKTATSRANKVAGMDYTALNGVRLSGQIPKVAPPLFFAGFLSDLVAEHINAYTGTPTDRIKDVKGLILSETLDDLVS